MQKNHTTHPTTVLKSNTSFQCSYRCGLLIINASRDQLWQHAIHSCQPNPIYHGCTCDRPFSVISFDIVKFLTRKGLSHCLTSKLAICAGRVSHRVLQWEVLLKKSLVIWQHHMFTATVKVGIHSLHKFARSFFYLFCVLLLINSTIAAHDFKSVILLLSFFSPLLKCRSQFFEWVLRDNKILKWPFLLPC